MQSNYDQQFVDLSPSEDASMSRSHSYQVKRIEPAEDKTEATIVRVFKQ
jgi:hypothetical protein